MNLDNWETQLRKGLFDILILNLLKHGRRHGYEMVQALKQNQKLKMREGSIYPILARLQTDGLVTSSSVTSRDGPPRRYFRLTKTGQKTLDEMNAHWDEVVDSIRSVRKGTHQCIQNTKNGTGSRPNTSDRSRKFFPRSEVLV
ncbi:MAG: PadR family transcriptional regulator [Planctomycetota bacterium]